ncbi:MAG: aromatic acid/H+ symport family MFS transporter [Micrococcales bacterium]|nr:aromatic acid/H+ symport family MFS transporter [Micrococcales bacterium]
MSAPPRGPLLAAPGWVAPLCWLAVVLDGFDAVVLGAIMPTLTSPDGLSLTAAEGTAVATAGLVGMMLGALSMGYLTDRLGRRKLLIGAVIAFSVFTFAAAFATGPTSLSVWRFLAGLGLGGCLPTGIAMVNEFRRSGGAGNATTTLMTGYHVGAVATAALALLLLKPFGWQGLFIAGALPMLVLVPLMVKYLPESPGYLMAQGRRAEAETVAAHYGIALEIPVEEEREYGDASPTHPHTEKQGAALMLSNAFRRNSIAIWIASFMGLLLVYGLNTWLPKIMREAGYELGAALMLLLVLNAGAVVGLVISGRVADRITPRLAAILWFAGSAVLLASLVIRLPMAGIYVMVFLTGCFVFSSQVLVYAFTSANHPPAVRATALGMSAGVGRLGAISGPLLGGLLLDRGLAHPWGFYAFAVVGALGALAMLGTRSLRVVREREVSEPVTA